MKSMKVQSLRSLRPELESFLARYLSLFGREENRGRPALLDALASTSGLWRRGDGLAWQGQLRGEWDRPRPKRTA